MFCAALLLLVLLGLYRHTIADGIFNVNQISSTVARNYPQHKPLPFVTPAIVSDANITYYLYIKPEQYLYAFSIRPTNIKSGEQFDIILEDSSIFQNIFTLILNIKAETENGNEAGNFNITYNIVDQTSKTPFQLPEYHFHPAEPTTNFVGEIKFNNETDAQNTDVKLYGSLSEYFNIEKQNNTLILSVVDCSSKCSKLPRSLVLLLRAFNAHSLETYDIPIYITPAAASIGHHTSKDGGKKLLGSRPKFKQPLWAFTIQEMSYSDEVIILEADDPDSSNLTYSLTSHNDVFAIDKNYGILTVNVPENLSIEKLGEHINLTVVVTDETNRTDSAVVIITLEPKNNAIISAPTFTQTIYAFAARPGIKYVGQVAAEHFHGKLTYYLSEGGAKAFSINSSNGAIYYNGPLEKNAHNYTLKILAVDDSIPPKIDITTVQVLIAGLESSPPKFITNDGIILTVEKDRSPNATLYEFVAKDQDPDAELYYSIDSIAVIDEIGGYLPDSINYLGHFSFQNNGINNGRLQMTKSFRNTAVSTVHLNIKVNDTKHHLEPEDRIKFIINLITTVKEVSEVELLQFLAMSKKVIVSEDIAIGSYVYTINVKPSAAGALKNYHVMYTLSQGQRYFSINQHTGVITTISSLHLLSSVNVTVLATLLETQRSSSTNLQVMVISSERKHTPEFIADSFVFSINENTPAGSSINGTVADSNDKNVTYAIEGEDSRLLKIDKEGVLHISEEIDREHKDQITAFVRASRSEEVFSLVPVIVNIGDVDDTAPVFTNRSYVASVMENSPINTFIAHAQAVDGDNSELSFSLMMNSDSAKLSSVLRVDNTGTIFNAEPLLGYSGEYQFAITARDRSHSGASANVFLTIVPYTRCQPQFLPQIPDVYELEENKHPPTVVARFTAEVPNKSCSLYYSLWNGKEFVEHDGIFFINTTNGEISTSDICDYEVTNRYSLMPIAHSGDSYEQFDMEVLVVDLDDNPIEIVDSELHFKVREDEQPGKRIGQVRAIDRDPSDKVYYHLVGQNKEFDVGLMDGIITLVSKIDREIRESYLLQVYVSNSEVLESIDLSDNIVAASVHIEIVDVNDNGPIFEKDLYVTAVHKDCLVGTKLLTVKAEDPDLQSDTAGSGNSVLYRIDEITYKNMNKSRQASGFVVIDEKTGEVSLGRSAHGFNGGVFECRILSADSPGADAHFAYAQLKVWPYEKKNVIEMEVEGNPRDFSASKLQEKMRQLSQIAGCKAHFLQLRYLKVDDHLQLSPFRVQFIVINETGGRLLDGDEAVELIDKNALTGTTNRPKLFTNLQMPESSTGHTHKFLTTGSSETILLLQIFLSLLCIVFTVLTCILCYFRAKYLREKKLYESDNAAAKDSSQNIRQKGATSTLSSEQRIWGKIARNADSYGVQEAVMAVEEDSPVQQPKYA